MKRDKISDREVWSDIFRNPSEYLPTIRYVVVSVACAVAILIIHVACSWRG